LVVSFVALFVALAGSAYALSAGSVTTREIANGTIRSKDVRFDGLNGNVIDESTLGAVTTADQLGGISSAGFVQTPDSVASVQRIDVRDTDASQELIFAGPLRFTIQCNGTDITDIRVLNNDGSSARIWLTWTQAGDTAPRIENYSAPNPPTGSTAIMPGYSDDAQVTFSYSNSVDVDVTGVMTIADAGAGGQPVAGVDCLVGGIATVAG
jgi:hypothetical protein